MSIFDKAKEVAKEAVETSKDVAFGVGEAAKKAGHAIADKTGEVTKKAGEVIVDAAEDVTGKDLNKDGKVGHKDQEKAG